MRPSTKSRAKARAVSETRKAQRLELHAARGPYCEACHLTPVGANRPWTEVHEILTRGRGGDPTDPGNQLCLCSECHRWITTHELEARALGLVRARTAEEHTSLYRPWEKPATAHEAN